MNFSKFVDFIVFLRKQNKKIMIFRRNTKLTLLLLSKESPQGFVYVLVLRRLEPSENSISKEFIAYLLLF
jgi:hypothetical protein